MTYYYLIALLLNFLLMYYNIRNGVIITFIIIFYILYRNIFKIKNNFIKLISYRTWLLIAYIIYNLITIINLISNGYNIEIAIKEIVNSILPIYFYFYALNNNEKVNKKFENVFLLSVFIMITSGIYYNLTLNDSKYIEYLNIVYPNFSLGYFIREPRLTSSVGSVVIGSLSVVAITITNLNIKNNIYKIILILIYFIGALLSFQRSAILVSFIVILNNILNYKDIRKNKYKINYIILFTLLILLFFVIIYSNVFILIFNRISTIFEAINERNSSWGFYKENILFYRITGIGIGSGGHRAIGYGKTINDGNYFKMLYEIGVVGTLLFMFLIINSFYITYMSKIKQKKLYIITIFGILLQAIGSNVLTFQLISPIFWFLLGKIEKKYNN